MDPCFVPSDFGGVFFLPFFGDAFFSIFSGGFTIDAVSAFTSFLAIFSFGLSCSSSEQMYSSTSRTVSVKNGKNVRLFLSYFVGKSYEYILPRLHRHDLRFFLLLLVVSHLFLQALFLFSAKKATLPFLKREKSTF